MKGSSGRVWIGANKASALSGPQPGRVARGVGRCPWRHRLAGRLSASPSARQASRGHAQRPAVRGRLRLRRGRDPGASSGSARLRPAEAVPGCVQWGAGCACPRQRANPWGSEGAGRVGPCPRKPSGAPGTPRQVFRNILRPGPLHLPWSRGVCAGFLSNGPMRERFCAYSAWLPWRIFCRHSEEFRNLYSLSVICFAG